MALKHDIITTSDGTKLAYRRSPGRDDLPGIIFLGGFRSDMSGSKATFLEEFCRARQQSFVRFDYRGHGLSSGKFEDGTIGLWRDDALYILDNLTQGPQILIGSSMGGWLALLLALQRSERLHALIGIAAAPDFTEDSFWKEFSPAQRQLITDGKPVEVPSDYGLPYLITKNLIEDGRRHLLLRASIPVHAPVHLLQGKKDTLVPWQMAETIAARLKGTQTQITYIDDGDHSLSRPEDLQILGKIAADYSRL